MTGPGPLEARFGTARRPGRPVAHPRFPHTDDATVEALGKLSAALEVVENARGFLYGFHRMTGEADLALQEALDALRAAGHTSVAEDISQVLVGRDVVGDNWTFQIVEAYDAQYWQVFRAAEEHARTELGGGRPHVYEAEMKHREQNDPQ